MTAEDFAARLNARRSGTGRWQARCPVHEDRSPSLSIRQGSDERILVHCFAGCSLAEILKATGLRIHDLFAGTPPTPEHANQLAVERGKVYAERHAASERYRTICDRARKLEAVSDALGDKLARTQDGAPEGDALTRLFHGTLERLRDADVEADKVFKALRKLEKIHG